VALAEAGAQAPFASRPLEEDADAFELDGILGRPALDPDQDSDLDPDLDPDLDSDLDSDPLEPPAPDPDPR
jgi:hypothetical protein